MRNDLPQISNSTCFGLLFPVWCKLLLLPSPPQQFVRLIDLKEDLNTNANINRAEIRLGGKHSVPGCRLAVHALNIAPITLVLRSLPALPQSHELALLFSPPSTLA